MVVMWDAVLRMTVKQHLGLAEGVPCQSQCLPWACERKAMAQDGSVFAVPYLVQLPPS